MSRLLDDATTFDSCGDGRYERDVEQGPFWGMVTPHGGYLMALMLAAMDREIDDATRKPRMLSQQFLGLVAPGRVVVEVTIERTGRGVTTATARMKSGDRIAGVATGLYSVDRDGPSFLDEPLPAVAEPELADSSLVHFMAPVHAQFDYHRRFGSDGRVVPVEDGGWVVPKARDGWDHRFAALLSDIWIPAIIRHPDRIAATPTLHHVIHFGPDVAGTADNAFLVRHRLSSGGGGVTDEDIALWSDDGRLLLRARQIRMAVEASTLLAKEGMTGSSPTSSS
jgi:acyl-CoA thioesterase